MCFRVFQGFLGPELNRGPFTGSLDRMYYCTRITWVKLVRDYFCLDIIWKVLSSSIPLFDSSLQLRGQGDDTGPAFNVALSGDHTDTPTLSASFTALVSINVGSQIDLGVEVGLDSSTSSFTLAGDYTAGNTKPSRWSKLQSGLWQCWHEMYRYVNVKTNCTDN